MMNNKTILALTLTLPLGLIACGGGSGDTANKKVAAKQGEYLIAKKGACSFLKDKEISSILNWKMGNFKKVEDKNLEKYNSSLCTYAPKSGHEKVSIKLAWQNEKNQEKKQLEHNYVNLFLNAKQGIKYIELEKDDNSQTIFKANSGTSGKMHYYSIKKRIGNTVDIEVYFASNKKNDKEFQDKAKEIISRLK